MPATRLERWRRGLRELRHPGAPPPGTLVLTVLLLSITGVVIAILIWLGLTRYDRAARYFGEGRPGTHYSGLLLVASAISAAGLARKAGGHPVRRFWWVFAGALLYLSLDEVYGLHEELDVGLHKLMGWRDERHWLTDHIDDVVVAAYGVIALVWADRQFEQLVKLRWTGVMLAVAFGCFVVMTVLDFAGIVAALEDSLKLIAETLILAGLITAYKQPQLTSA